MDPRFRGDDGLLGDNVYVLEWLPVVDYDLRTERSRRIAVMPTALPVFRQYPLVPLPSYHKKLNNINRISI
jgi:hypothetical protein